MLPCLDQQLHALKRRSLDSEVHIMEKYTGFWTVILPEEVTIRPGPNEVNYQQSKYNDQDE
jgi:hypothetical protein